MPTCYFNYSSKESYKNIAPLIAGHNEIQELSKTYYHVTLSRTRLKHPIPTCYSVIVCQPQHPIRDLFILVVTLCRIVTTDFSHRANLAGQPYRNLSVMYRSFGHLTPARWPHYFFVMASFRISALRRSSA